MLPAHPRLAFLVPPKNQLSKYWETGAKIGRTATEMWRSHRVCLLGNFQRPALIRKCAFL